jgi:hypothetical protein
MAMRVSDFMLNLQKRLQEERKVVESTAIQYLQSLHSLNGGKPFNNLAWTKKFDTVQAAIDGYAKSTQSTMYKVLASVLSLFADKATYKAAYTHWKDKMMEARKERESEPVHEKNDKQEENWLDWPEVEKKKSGLKQEISSFISTKHITPLQFEKLLQFVVLSLYTDIPPRRNTDFLEMYVIKKMCKDCDKTKNYYDLATHKFHFFVYKTAKSYGEQVVDVPEELQQTLADYFKFHPLARTKAKEFKLLVKQDGSPLTTVNAITRILNRIFGKKVGSSMLRHIYLTSKYGNTIEQMEKDSMAMAHSVGQQSEYIKNE